MTDLSVKKNLRHFSEEQKRRRKERSNCKEKNDLSVNVGCWMQILVRDNGVEIGEADAIPSYVMADITKDAKRILAQKQLEATPPAPLDEPATISSSTNMDLLMKAAEKSNPLAAAVSSSPAAHSSQPADTSTPGVSHPTNEDNSPGLIKSPRLPSSNAMDVTSAGFKSTALTFSSCSDKSVEKGEKMNESDDENNDVEKGVSTALALEKQTLSSEEKKKQEEAQKMLAGEQRLQEETILCVDEKKQK